MKDAMTKAGAPSSTDFQAYFNDNFPIENTQKMARILRFNGQILAIGTENGPKSMPRNDRNTIMAKILPECIIPRIKIKHDIPNTPEGENFMQEIALAALKEHNENQTRIKEYGIMTEERFWEIAKDMDWDDGLIALVWRPRDEGKFPDDEETEQRIRSCLNTLQVGMTVSWLFNDVHRCDCKNCKTHETCTHFASMN